MNVIDAEKLFFSYRDNAVLEDLSFGVQEGSFVAIAGPNGSGKTTLLNLLCGLLRPDKGRITIATEPIRKYSVKKLAQKVSVVRQEFTPVFGFTAAQIVLTARTACFNQLGFERKADRQAVFDALRTTETEQFASRPLSQLSGGERQRVFIARALAQNTPILLLDEPTSFLDLRHQVGIYDLLKSFQLEKKKTIIVVTHDINLAAQYADTVLLLGSDRKYIFGPARELLYSEQIERTFGVKTFSGQIGGQKFFIPIGKFLEQKTVVKDDIPGKRDI